MNYHFVECSAKDIKKKLKEYYHQDRKDLIVLAEVTVTLPKDVREEDEEKFFKGCYEFFCNDFGKENVVNAVVHRDETTDHLHLDFLPVKDLEPEDKMTNCMKERIASYEAQNGKVKGRLCAREVLSREYYASFHTRLLDFMTKRLGYQCEILNGATANGNKTLLELKNASAEAKLKSLEQQITTKTTNMNYILESIKKIGLDEKYFNCPELLVYMAILEQENEMLKTAMSKTMASYNISFDEKQKQDLDKFKNMRKVLFEKTHFSMVLEENLDINTDYVRVIETYKDKARIMPDWKLIESIPELEDIINREPKELCYYDLGSKGRYLIFPTDNIGDTAQNLIQMRDNEKTYMRKGMDKFVFPQISNDTYNMAETVLKGCEFETVYKLRKKKDDKERTQYRYIGD